MLAELLASMKDSNGRVTVKGFYDVIPLSSSEKSGFIRSSSVDEQMKTELGMGNPEMKHSIAKQINLPSLNINGMHSGNVGKWHQIKFYYGNSST
jgi:hypothetical protein